ncbi:hypothetical protein NFI96_005274, partial [Prochilodus magdalenae]
CTLENREQLQTITAHTGGSVLLPCSCTDLQTKPEEFSWKKYNRNTQTWVEVSRESGNVMYWFILIPVLLLLLGIGGVIYWRCRGCTLENSALLTITAHTGGSVLLPCSCTDLQTKPESFTWWKHNRNNQEEISRESGQYRNRVQLFNNHSPGNLSLLISHLTEEDGGDYECASKDIDYVFLRLTIKGCTLGRTSNHYWTITLHNSEEGQYCCPAPALNLQTKPEELRC